MSEQGFARHDQLCERNLYMSGYCNCKARAIPVASQVHSCNQGVIDRLTEENKRQREEVERLKEKLVIAKAALNNIACIDCWREDERCLDRECNLARVALFRLSDPKETEGGAK